MVCKSDSLHWVDSINERFCGWLVWISYRENHKKIPGFVCVYLPEWLILVNLCDASWRRDKMPRRCDTFLAGYHFNWDRFYFVADTARIVMLMLIAHCSCQCSVYVVRCTKCVRSNPITQSIIIKWIDVSFWASKIRLDPGNLVRRLPFITLATRIPLLCVDCRTDVRTTFTQLKYIKWKWSHSVHTSLNRLNNSLGTKDKRIAWANGECVLINK